MDTMKMKKYFGSKFLIILISIFWVFSLFDLIAFLSVDMFIRHNFFIVLKIIGLVIIIPTVIYKQKKLFLCLSIYLLVELIYSYHYLNQYSISSIIIDYNYFLRFFGSEEYTDPKYYWLILILVLLILFLYSAFLSFKKLKHE